MILLNYTAIDVIFKPVYHLNMKFRLACFALLFIFAAVTVQAQIFPAYRPFASFRVIKTEYFDIIFPVESEPSARILSTYADSVYEELSSLFGISIRGRLPVTFAPHTDLYNGYYSPVSRPHIVIFDTAMDLERNTYEDSLKGIFIHELTHAITMNTRGPFYRFLNRVFGNWATPALWTAPAFMVEGAAISMESLGGFGRANDPFVKQILRQAVYEGRFHTPFQASGVYDSPGQPGIFYEYGGLFSVWLQQRYGMEKYAELWRAMGRNSFIDIFVYRSGFYRIFKMVYGIDFLDTWNAFRDSFALYGIEENHDEILSAQRRFFTRSRNDISAMAAGKNEVFILDSTEEKVRVYDTLTGNTRSFNTGSRLSYDLDVSDCGAALLVSGYHMTGEQRYRAVVTEHRADSGRRTGRTIRGLYKARYFRDGVIGITAELHNNSIVYKDFDGSTEILFRGNERLLFSGPQALDDERIAFVAARSGVRELMLYNYVSGELFRIENSCGDNEYWRFMRGLGVSQGKLLFSHNVNDRMYKLAYIDPENMRAIFNNRDFSGGVFYPVSVNGNVYYSGNFFSGDGALRFPENIFSLSGAQTEIKFVQVCGGDYGLAADWNFLPEELNENNLSVLPSRRYFAIRYMNPFNFWLPLPLIRIDSNFRFSFDGAGLMSVIMDPADRNLIMFFGYADITNRMAMIDSFTWQTTVPGFPVTLEFSDKAESGIRSTRVDLGASFFMVPGRWTFGISLGGGYARFAFANGEPSAYDWGDVQHHFYYSAGFSFSNRMRRQHELFGTGMTFSLRGISVADSFQPRVEGRFQISMETRFPFSFVFYGAYDKQGMNIHGVSRRYGQPLFSNSASVEYTVHGGLSFPWIAGAEASIGLFSFEIQRNLSHIYFNRFFGSLSLRNVLYNSGGHPGAEGITIGDLHLAQSLVLKFGLVSSVIALKYVPFFLEPNIWGSWNFSNTITGKGNQLNFGFGFGLRY